MERITGSALATAMLSWLESWNIDVKNCRGQGYDGASNMSSSRAGVQGCIQEVAPLAFYVPLISWTFVLSVGVVFPKFKCKWNNIWNFFKLFQQLAKTSALFETIIDSKLVSTDKAKLKDICRTWWIQRYSYILWALPICSPDNASNVYQEWFRTGMGWRDCY